MTNHLHPRRPRPAASVLGLAAVIWGCQEAPAAVMALGAPPAADEAIGWATATAARDPVLFEAPARAVAGPGAAGAVGVPARGRLARLLVRPGDRVAAGDLVAELAAPELVEAAAVLRGTAGQLAAHRRRLTELRKLRAEGLVRSAEVFELEATVASLEAAGLRARSLLRAAGQGDGDLDRLLADGILSLRAPLAGVVLDLHGEVGATLAPDGPPLVRIAGEAPCRIEVRSHAAWPGSVAMTWVGSDGQTVALTAEPVAMALDSEDGSRIAWFEPAAGPSPQAGARGVVRGMADGAVVQVPATALLRDDEWVHVLRRAPAAGQEPERVRVTVIAASAGHAVVRGLEPGDTVVADVDRMAAPDTEPDP